MSLLARLLVEPTKASKRPATLGWRSIFLLNVPLGALGLAMAVRFVPRHRPARAETWTTCQRNYRRPRACGAYLGLD